MALEPWARPVYTAPVGPAASCVAVVPPFQAAMVPLRVSKMKVALVPVGPPTQKEPAGAVLKTWPVGPEGGVLEPGMVTTKACGAPVAL